MRSEFTMKTKALAFERCCGLCEGTRPDGERCGIVLRPGRWDADHRIACELGGDNSLENCQCLCEPCHRRKTGQQDIPVIAKTKRLHRRAIGIRKRRTIRAWRRFDGTPVYADD